MTHTLSAQTRAELAMLDDAAIFSLLGDILDPGTSSPFDMSDDMADALLPITEAYRDAFRAVSAALAERSTYNWMQEDADEASRKYGECVA